MKGFLTAKDGEEAGRVVERCRLTQFEAEIWNALNQTDPNERKGLCKAAMDSLNPPAWHIKVDPSKCVPAFWQVTKDMVKGKAKDPSKKP